MVCAGGAQTYFSPMLPTCVHFRKMEEFSSSATKVPEHENATATLRYWYNSIAKAVIYSKKHPFGGGEFENVYFRRAFSKEKRCI